MESTGNVVNVIVREDKSVEKKINKSAKKLRKNYDANRTINEKRLARTKSPLSIAVSVILDIVVAIVVICCASMVVSTISCRMQNVNPSFAGYSQFKISSKSMTASGFYVGDNIVVRSVDPSSLKVGDKIAFYQYTKSSNKFNSRTCLKVNQSPELKHKVGLLQFFGVQSKEIEEAAQAGSRLVFHHVYAIYKDSKTGKYWFQTKGSSNIPVDDWYVEDSMIVGIYDDSSAAVFVSSVLTKLTSSSSMIMLIMIPVLLMAMLVVMAFFKDVEIAKLELDIVQEKRKLTDPICVKYEIGYQMAEKTKYKVLAQAPDDQKVEYLSLLWRDGSAPNAIKKYCMRKQILISTLEKELEIHRQCDQMFKEGVPDKQIAKFYCVEKQKIEKDYSSKQKQLKKIKNSTDINSVK